MINATAVIAEWNASEEDWLARAVSPWSDKCFPDLVLAPGDGPAADQPAVIYRDKVWSHRELAAAVHSAARNLVGWHKVRPRETVMLKMENSDLFIIAYLAVHRAGATAIPLNPKLTDHEVRYMVGDSSPALMLVADASAISHELKASVPIVVASELLSQHNGCAVQPLPQVSPDDIATIFYTSGTTGAPKGVIHTHRTLITGAFQNCRGWGYEGRGSVTLAMTPLFHIAAHSWFYPVLANEGTLIVDTFGTERALELITRHKVDGFGAVPAMLLMLMDHPSRSAYDLRSIRNIRFGASSIPPERISLLRTVFPNARLFHGMGQTESGGTISVLPDEYAVSKLGSSGFPIPGVSVRIVDDQGQVVQRGVPGEIIAKGPHVMVGYLNQREATNRTLQDGWLFTGDVGIMDDDGMVMIVDRKKDMIIRGGENIYSTEVENVFLSHPQIKQCAVVGVPDPLLQETVAAVIVTEAEPDARLREALIAFGKERLAPFKIPARWFFTSSLPCTATGKIQKQLIRDAVSGANLTEF